MTEQPSLKKLANDALNFDDFHAKAENRLYQVTPRRQGKNLQELALESVSFSDFHQRTTENEDEV